MPSLVSVHKTNSTAVCTLSLPHKRNPLSAAMRRALMEAMEELKGDSAVRSVILTGSEGAFCSGMDLNELKALSGLSKAKQRVDSLSIRTFFEYIYSYPKPTIAAVNGAAVAGGAGLALICDLTVMAQEAFLSFSEVRIGFVPAIVSVYLLRLAGPKCTRELLFTGKRLPAREALGLGLVNSVVSGRKLLHHASKLADQIRHSGPLAVQMTKKMLIDTESLSFEENMKRAVKCNALARSSLECREGVQAFFEKRAPRWKGLG